MFVKIDNYWLNTQHIVNLEPQGKSFRVDLSNGAFLVLNWKNYLILAKAIKIKTSVKIPSPAVSGNAKPKRVAGKGTKANKQAELGKGASGGVPKTKLVKKTLTAKPMPKKKEPAKKVK